ncbi:MAG: hypothetical protein DRP09_11020 [Candidatus Thorarchaeota archaeon]|nr:MAG: hypothetical protein DRP09_11020 [Candidatus Thorarchaeota archaeon]
MANKGKAKTNESLAKEVVRKFTHSMTWREPFKQKWDRFYKMYRSHMTETAYPWQSKLWVPYSFSTVETLVPRMVSNQPQIDILPREPNDIEYAKIQSQLIDFQWEKMGMNEMMPEVAKGMAMYGTSILKVYWDRQERKTMSKVLVDELNPELGHIEEEVEEVFADNPAVENVDLIDFFWDPRGIDIESCRWVAHRMYRTQKHLEEQQKRGIYKNVKLVKGTGLSYEDDQKSMRRGVLGVAIPDDVTDPGKKEDLIELIEYWEDDRVVTVANRSIIIREEDNPYKHGKKPFVRIVDQAVQHEFLGIGELEPIESLQYELNDRRNQRMDNVTLALNRGWLVEEGSGVDEDELVSEPGFVVHAHDKDKVEQMTTPDVTASSYQEETLIKADIQQATGVSDFTRGVGSDALANDTATGISLIQEAGNARFRLKIKNLEMGIQKIGQMMVSLNEQFINDEQVIRIMGDAGAEWVTVRPDDMRGNLDVKVAAGSTLPSNEAVNRKQTMEAFQIFAGDPEINQTELKRMVLKTILPDGDTDKLLGQQANQGIAPEGIQPTQPGPQAAIPDGQLDQEGILRSTLANAETI